MSHGKNGENGENGENGKNGKNGQNENFLNINCLFRRLHETDQLLNKLPN